MSVYLYCIRRAGEVPPEPGLRGLSGSSVSLFETGDLGAWISETAEVQPTPNAVREHDRVVRAALRSATPLPLRFGAFFRDVAVLREALDARREEFLSTLARVSGRVEVGITVGWDEQAERAALLAERTEVHAPIQAPGAGRAYLEHRRRRLREDELLRRRADALLDRIEAALDLADVSSARHLLPRPGVAGSLAHLLRRDCVMKYRQTICHVQRAFPHHGLTLSGPWAPYSFV